MRNTSSSTVTVNSFAKLVRADTTTAGLSGNSVRYRVTIDARSATLNFNAKALGSGPSQAIAKHLRERVAGIGVQAKPSTIATRKRDLLAAGKGGNQYLSNRYAPSRGNPSPKPSQSDKLFNDSGTFAKGIAVGAAKGDVWVINAPASRLTARYLHGGEGALSAIFDQLVGLVPEIGKPALLRDVLSIAKAIREGRVMIDPRIGKGVSQADVKRAYKRIAEIVEGAAALVA